MAYHPAERKIRELLEKKKILQELETMQEKQAHDLAALRLSIRSRAQDIGKKKKELIDSIRA